MAITATSYGSANNKTAATTVAFNTTALIPANTLLVLAVCADNVAAATPTITSITAVGGGTWTNQAGSTTQSGATTTAGTGVFVYCYTLFTTSSVASGTAITVTFNASPVAKAVALSGFTEASSNLRGTPASGGSTVGAPAANLLNTTGLVAGDLIIGVVGVENSVASSVDPNTFLGTWALGNSAASTGAGAVTNCAVGIQYKVANGSQGGSILTFGPPQNGSSSDAVAIVLAIQPAVVPAITQAAYQFFDQGTETGSPTLGALNTPINGNLASGDGIGALRVRLQSTNAGLLLATDDYRLQWEKNASGTWWDVGAASLADGYTVAAGGVTPWQGTLMQSGQSFTGNGQLLSQVAFSTLLTGTPPGNVFVEIYAHSGTFGTDGVPTGSPLITSTPIPAGSVVNANFTFFNFTSTLVLVNGTKYFAILNVSTAGNVSNSISAVYNSITPFHPGNRATFAGGGWGADSTTDYLFQVLTTGVIQYDDPSLTDGAATTNRLGAGTGSFVAGKVSETGDIPNFNWTANNYTELLYPVLIKKPSFANGDAIRFRVIRNGVTTTMTYTQTPLINVVAGAATVQATVATTFSYTGTSTATPQHEATAASSFTFTAAATAAIPAVVQATITTAFSFSTTAAALPQHEASVVGPFALTATATATPQHEATVSGPFIFTTTAAATAVHPATVATVFAFSTTAAADVSHPATVATTFTFTATAIAVVPTVVPATISTTFGFTATGAATPQHEAMASGPFAFTTTATAVTQRAAAASGPFAFATTATADVSHSASVATAFTFSTTAIAIPQHEATASGPFTFSAVTAADLIHPAAVATSFTFTATATATSTSGAATIPAAITTAFLFGATAIAVPQHEATVATAFSFVTTAAATPQREATASGPFTFATTATASVSRPASIATVLSFSTTAAAVPQHPATIVTPFTFAATAAAAPFGSGQAIIATAFIFTATTNAVVVPADQASIATVFGFTATATAVAQRDAVASGVFTFTTQATAVPIHPAVVATTYVFITTATAVPSRAAIIATQFTFTTTLTAGVTHPALATGTYTFTAIASASATLGGTVLNNADVLLIGSAGAQAAYVGAVKVWSL